MGAAYFFFFAFLADDFVLQLPQAMCATPFRQGSGHCRGAMPARSLCTRYHIRAR